MKFVLISTMCLTSLMLTGCGAQDSNSKLVDEPTNPVKQEVVKDDVVLEYRPTDPANDNIQVPVIIEVDAQRFSFTPSEIRVQQGEKVLMKVNDIDADHGAEFKDMDVIYNTDGTILLDTSVPGTYEFRCATMCGGGHNDMVGNVIVE